MLWCYNFCLLLQMKNGVKKMLCRTMLPIILFFLTPLPCSLPVFWLQRRPLQELVRHNQQRGRCPRVQHPSLRSVEKAGNAVRRYNRSARASDGRLVPCSAKHLQPGPHNIYWVRDASSKHTSAPTSSCLVGYNTPYRPGCKVTPIVLAQLQLSYSSVRRPPYPRRRRKGQQRCPIPFLVLINIPVCTSIVQNNRRTSAYICRRWEWICRLPTEERTRERERGRGREREKEKGWGRERCWSWRWSDGMQHTQ